jgi:hypothetical protein
MRRRRHGEHISFEEFSNVEMQEAMNPEKHNQNIKAVMDMADFTIVNEGTEEALFAQIDRVMSAIL